MGAGDKGERQGDFLPGSSHLSAHRNGLWHRLDGGDQVPGALTKHRSKPKCYLLFCACVFHSSEWGQISFSLHVSGERSGLGEEDFVEMK